MIIGTIGINCIIISHTTTSITGNILKINMTHKNNKKLKYIGNEYGNFNLKFVFIVVKNRFS